MAALPGQQSFVHSVEDKICSDRWCTMCDLSLHFPGISKYLLYEFLAKHLHHKKLFKMGKKLLMHIHKTKCGSSFTIFVARKNVFLLKNYYWWWQDLSQDTKKETITAMMAYWVPKSKKIQDNSSCKKTHLYHFLGLSRNYLVEFMSKGTIINAEVKCQS